MLVRLIAPNRPNVVGSRRPGLPPGATRLVASVFVCAVVLGISGVAGAAGSARARRSSSVASANRGGCGLATAPGQRTVVMTLAGRKRTVLVDLPADYAGTTPVPLVVNLQGNGSSAPREAMLSGMDAEADRGGFIVAYPQALVASGPGYSWNPPGAPAPPGSHRPNDLAFLSELPAALESRYCIDTTRVYVVGFGAGAAMAAQLACNDSNIVAAFGAVSGPLWPSACPAIRPLAVIAFQGGSAANPADVRSPAHGARNWASADGCRARPVLVVPAAGARLTSYIGCRAGVDVELYTVVGEGRGWPGGPLLARSVTSRTGAQSDVLDANQLMWAFFEAHKLP